MKKYFVFFFVSVLGVMVFSCNNENGVEKRLEIIEHISASQERLAGFVNILASEIDTSFEIDYRSRDDSYHFFYFQNETIKGSFNPSDRLKGVVATEGGYFKFRNIWKYEDENIYRLGISWKRKIFVIVCILDEKEADFIFSKKSKISELDIVENINDVGNLGSRPFLYFISKSVMINFKKFE